MANNIGIGSGNSNPFLQAARLNQQGPAETYDPNQTLDATQMAGQVFQQQSALRSQQFNQENPRMALPQNFGASLGQVVQKALGVQQQAAPQQQTDPTQVAQAAIQQAVTSNLQAQIQNGEVPNYGKAKYMAGVQALTGSGGNQTMQAIAAKYISESKYTPESEQASQDKDTAAHDSATKSHMDTLKAQQDAVYQVVDMAADKDGLPSYKQYGTAVPLIGGDGKVDPSFPSKQQAALDAAKSAGAKNPVFRTVSEITAYQGALQRDRDAATLARVAAQEKERTDAVANANQDLINNNAMGLVHGDVLLSDLAKGNSPTAQAIYQGSMTKAYQYAKEMGVQFSPTDMANRKRAEGNWMSGTMNTQYNKAATVPRHLTDLEQIGATLGAGDFKPGNRWYQVAMRATNQGAGQNVPSFDLAKQVFALELGGALNQRGGSGDERKALTDQIMAADGPETLQKTLRTEEKLWADKFDDLATNYEQNVKGKRFFGDVVNPARQTDAVNIYSKYYPIATGTGDSAKYYFDMLPDTATVKTPGGRVMSAANLRALEKSNQVPK